MIFLSYKSETANLVRVVAEILTSNKINVWFAEHCISLENIDKIKASKIENNKIQDDINNGITKATHAIFFTNFKWKNESDWCQDEYRQLLKKINIEERRTLEILVPLGKETENRYTDVTKVPFIIKFEKDHQYPNWDDIKVLISEIGRYFKIDSLHFPKIDYSLERRRIFPNYRFSISPGFLKAKLSDNSETGLDFFRANIRFSGWYEEHLVNLNLFFSLYDSSLSEKSKALGQKIDDRGIYEDYLQYAKNWIDNYYQDSNLKMNCKGLHLLFIHNVSQFGLTIRTDGLADQDKNLWDRRYVIPLENSGTLDVGEVSLIFTVNLFGGEEHQFQEFSRLSTIFDDIARTFRFNPSLNRKDEIINTSGPFMARLLYLLLIFYLIFCSNIDFFLRPLVTFICTFAAGLTIYDLYALLTVRVHREFMWKFQPVEDQLHESTYERISSGTVNGLFSYLILLLSISTLTAVKFWAKNIFKASVVIVSIALFIYLEYVTLWSIAQDFKRVITTFLGLIAGCFHGYFFVKMQISILSKKRIDY